MPKNEVSSTTSLGSSIDLRLFYKNPYAQSELDEYAKDVQSFTQDELYGAQCVEITCGLKSTGLENITYLNGLLIIRTTPILIYFYLAIHRPTVAYRNGRSLRF